MVGFLNLLCGRSSFFDVIFVRWVPENVTQREKGGGLQKGEILGDEFYEWPPCRKSRLEYLRPGMAKI